MMIDSKFYLITQRNRARAKKREKIKRKRLFYFHFYLSLEHSLFKQKGYWDINNEIKKKLFLRIILQSEKMQSMYPVPKKMFPRHGHIHSLKQEVKKPYLSQ